MSDRYFYVNGRRYRMRAGFLSRLSKRAITIDSFQQMMYVSGETTEPSIETTGIIEDIVRQQVIELVCQPLYPLHIINLTKISGSYATALSLPLVVVQNRSALTISSFKSATTKPKYLVYAHFSPGKTSAKTSRIPTTKAQTQISPPAMMLSAVLSLEAP